MIILSIFLLALIIALVFMFSSVYVSIVSIFTNQKIIILHDFQYKTYLSLERNAYNGKKVAYVYPTYKIGNVILLPDGKIDKESVSTYIKHWEYLNKKNNKNASTQKTSNN